MSSVAFAEQIAYYALEAERSGLIEREPTPDELGVKFAAAFALHNAKAAR